MIDGYLITGRKANGRTCELWRTDWADAWKATYFIRKLGYDSSGPCDPWLTTLVWGNPGEFHFMQGDGRVRVRKGPVTPYVGYDDHNAKMRACEAMVNAMRYNGERDDG